MATTLAAPALPSKIRAQLRELHAGMLPPLVGALEAAGEPHAARTANLIQGIVNAAVMCLVPREIKEPHADILRELFDIGDAAVGDSRPQRRS